MKAATVCLVLACIALFAGAAVAQRQDEALDSLMLSSNLQPVNDPIPRLLQEALESAQATPGSYGAPAGAATVVAPAASPAPARSASTSTAAGALSLAAAVAAAALLL